MAEVEIDTADDALDPAPEAKDSRHWLALITAGEKAFDEWQSKADNIDKLYANLEKLANLNRDREFQLFWANIQVLAPSIYSRPPQPVIVPKFKDRSRPVVRTASEILERAAVVSFEQESIDETMKLLRDDMATVGRGAAWLRYAAEKEDGKLRQRLCIDQVFRRDFLHDPARKWKEVDWVAKRSWLTRKEARKRFRKTSGDAYQNAAYAVRKDEVTGETDNRLKAGFWELWSKSENKVVWVTEGVEVLLDEDKPHLKLEGFFPAPRPAYATVQRNSLVPVPDMLFYKDQLEEINEITGRISALSESLRLRGFYPAGAGEIGDAIEAAIKSVNQNQVLVPISNWAQFGSGQAKDMILWLPLDMVATTIQQLIELRKQLIDDVYQITGLSDIMRGSTVASETLGAQQLKSQYGSIRVRDRQEELVRIARDITRLQAEIHAENFSGQTLLEMSQLQVPTDADVKGLVQQLQQQLATTQAEIADAQQDPEIQQMAQQNPKAAQQALAQAQQQATGLQEQIGKLEKTVTIEQVMKFLRDNRIRGFTLDIETDSTIAPDEDAQKQRATEYITSMSGLIAQAVPAVQQTPQLAPLIADIIRFANSQFRVGRQFEQTVEEFTDQMKQLASAPRNEGPNQDQIKAQAEAKAMEQRTQIEAQKAEADAAKAKADAERITVENAERMQALQAKQADEDLARAVREQEAFDASKAREAEIGGKERLSAAQLAAAEEARVNAAQKHQQDMDLGSLNILLLNTKINQAEVATDNSVRTTTAAVKAKSAPKPQKEAP